MKINNDSRAELCASYPDRFVAFASVAQQYPDLAVQQLEHAVKKQGLRGAAVGASVARASLSASMERMKAGVGCFAPPRHAG